MSLHKQIHFGLAAMLFTALSANAAEVLKIMPLGDSNTRGTYPVSEAGPHPASIGAGGYRYPLQQMLTNGGYRFDFVGSQTSNSVGGQGDDPPATWTYDSAFDRDHQGLAGFTNSGLITGGNVPTFTGDPIIAAPSLVNALSLYQPDIVLLMSGTNGLNTSNIATNLQTLNNVIQTITTNSPSTRVIVSTLYDRWDSTAMHDATETYNVGIPSLVTAAQASGKRVTFVDTGAVLTYDNFCYSGTTTDWKADRVHPDPLSLAKPAAVWYEGIRAVATPAPEPGTMLMMILAAALVYLRRVFE